MSTRCISCNTELKEYEISSTKLDGTPEDMCLSCRHKARSQYIWTEEYGRDFLGSEDVDIDKFKDYYEGEFV